MATPELSNRFQHVSLTSDESETEACSEQLPMDIDDGPLRGRLPQGRFPADTPVTPPVVGYSHRQFCDKVLGEVLPGDGSGRGPFDIYPTFVVGDPSAKFDTHTPLSYDTSGELGHPIWSWWILILST